jgi:hypothetical protein
VPTTAHFTGNGFGWQNYSATYADQGIGIVLLSNSDNFESVAHEILAKAIGDLYTPCDWLGYMPFDPSKPTPAPPPDLTPIEVDQAILKTYAGTYHIQGAPPFPVKFQDGKLEIRSIDGKRWNPLFAETETRFFVPGEETFRFEFIRDRSGNATALRWEVQGLPLPAAPRVEL